MQTLRQWLTWPVIMKSVSFYQVKCPIQSWKCVGTHRHAEDLGLKVRMVEIHCRKLKSLKANHLFLKTKGKVKSFI